MASSSATIISRSIQQLLRRHGAASAPALLAIAGGKSVAGRPLPINPIAQDPVSATNVGFSGRSIEMALFGRVDWPAMPSSEPGRVLAKNSDSDEDLDDDDDEFDSEDFDDVDLSDVDDDDAEDEPPTKSKKRS